MMVTNRKTNCWQNSTSWRSCVFHSVSKHTRMRIGGARMESNPLTTMVDGETGEISNSAQLKYPEPKTLVSIKGKFFTLTILDTSWPDMSSGIWTLCHVYIYCMTPDISALPYQVKSWALQDYIFSTTPQLSPSVSVYVAPTQLVGPWTFLYHGFSTLPAGRNLRFFNSPTLIEDKIFALSMDSSQILLASPKDLPSDLRPLIKSIRIEL